MKRLFIAISLLLLSNISYSQPLFSDNFNYPVTDTLFKVGSWARIGSLSSAPFVKVVTPGLSYTGYINSGIGNCVMMTHPATGNGALHMFSQKVSGTVYMSFLFRLDSFATSSTQAFIANFDELGGSTNFNTKVFIKKVNSSTFNFGIQKYTGAVKFSPVVYSKNTTYLVVASYTFRAGTDDDFCNLHVFSSGVPAVEPASPLVSDTTGSDINDIGEIALINSFIQSGLQGSLTRMDGIRVGDSWNSTLFQSLNMELNLNAFIQGFYKGNSKMVPDTMSVVLRYKTSPYTFADIAKVKLDSNGYGKFLFSKVGNDVHYYLILKHRNSIETWSASPRFFTNNNANYDFTAFASNAYGNNQILAGTEYCIYNGDVNQDGYVELSDIIDIFNQSNIFASGYIPQDVNGDTFVDLSDLVLAFNNSSNFVGIVRP